MTDYTRNWVVYQDTDDTWWIQLTDDPEQAAFRVTPVLGTAHWICYRDDQNRDWAIPRHRRS